MVERSGLGWSLAFILLRALLLLGRASTSQVMSYHVLGVPGRNTSCSPLFLSLSLGTHWHWDPILSHIPSLLAWLDQEKICIQGCDWQAHHWDGGDSGVTAGQGFIWGYSWSQQGVKKVSSVAISITQAITAEHPEPQITTPIHP